MHARIVTIGDVHPPDVLVLSDGLVLPLAEIRVRTMRSSGPGGQHANVTASRVEVSFDVAASTTLSGRQKHLVTERCGPVVRAVAQEARSQLRNREVALERLAQRLNEALHVDAPRRPTRPSKASRRRRADHKRRQGERKRLRRKPDAGD